MIKGIVAAHKTVLRFSGIFIRIPHQILPEKARLNYRLVNIDWPIAVASSPRPVGIAIVSFFRWLLCGLHMFLVALGHWHAGDHAKLIKRFLEFLMGNNCTYRVARLLTNYPLAQNRPATNNSIL